MYDWKFGYSATGLTGDISKLVSSCECFPGDSDGKESACNAGDLGLIPGLGSPGDLLQIPGLGSPGDLLQISWRREWLPIPYSCLENSMDREPGRRQPMELQRVRHD